MKIKGLTIRNFRSLRKIHLEDLGNLVILIGENNSGKTNMLEALEQFLTSFPFHSALLYQRRLEPDDWYLWYKGDTKKPVEFHCTLELDDEESQKLINVTKVDQKVELKITRSLVCEKGDYLYLRNDLINWGSVTLKREDDRYVTGEELKFDLNSFTQTTDTILKEGFNYISLGREDKPKIAHGSVLDPPLKEELIKMAEDTSSPGIMKWDRWSSETSDWLSGGIECKGGRLLLRKGTVSLPYELEGGGYQAVLNLMEKIKRGGDVVAIEEPENHLHPDLQKRLIKGFDRLLDSKKQIFIATHSPFIVDQANLKSLWFVWKEEMESKIANIATAKELGNALWTIGVKPSDFLFANGVMVVEGPTDKDVYADWARKIGKPFEEVGILVIDAEGCKNITKYLNSKVIQRTTFKLYCLADRNAEWVKEKVESVVPKDNMLFLDRGDLEDYYHHDIVLPFAREMALKRGKKEEEIPSEIKVGETVKTLNNLLCGDWWKRPLADKVISEMAPDQINKEIRTKLGKIYDKLSK